MGNVPPSALRQPPPPPPPGCRGQLIDSNMELAPTSSRVRCRPFYSRKCKKRNTSDSMIESLPDELLVELAPTPSRVRSRPFFSRVCKSGNPSNSIIESLPDELLMEILVRLSADEIYDNARRVSRRWRLLIHSDAFVCEHLHRASSGLLLTRISCPKDSPVFMTTTTQGRVETSRLSCRINFAIIFSCNGLAFCMRSDGRRMVGKKPFIFNPATKSAFDLPMFPVTGKVLGPLLDRILGKAFVMAYAASSMAYKVVGTYGTDCNAGVVAQCFILTVGVDKTWRHVALEGLSANAKNIVMLYAPLTTGGFVHWFSRTHVVSLNVETEIFTATRIPPIMFPQGNYTSRCLSTGERLSIFIPCGDNWSWRVWEIKPEPWKWRKRPNINLEAHKCKIQQFALKEDNVLKPVGWVRYPEVLAFFFNGFCRYCIIYNLYTEEFESIELPFPDAGHSVVQQHMNSLVWLERC